MEHVMLFGGDHWMRADVTPTSRATFSTFPGPEICEMKLQLDGWDQSTIIQKNVILTVWIII